MTISNNTDGIILSDEKTWPKEIVSFLESKGNVFLAWERGQYRHAQSYDIAVKEFRHILSKYSLRGYHCTRLTDNEILTIEGKGLFPQNRDILSSRIDQLVAQGELPHSVATRLKENNLANEKNRTGMIWFCFFPPNLQARGIKRFFESWGGEALYNGYEDEPEIGPLLKKIGTPYIIETIVPIKNDKHIGLEDKFSRIFFNSRGEKSEEYTQHEGYSTNAIPGANIAKYIRWPSEEFKELSGNWEQT